MRPIFRISALRSKPLRRGRKGAWCIRTAQSPLRSLAIRVLGREVSTDKFLRLDLEDLPIPSFHRPDLVNFWNHRLLKYLADQVECQPTMMRCGPSFSRIDDKWTVTHNAGSNGRRCGPDLGDQAADHAAADARGSPALRWQQSGSRPRPTSPASNGFGRERQSIAIPTLEIVGPWDVDNDNDGVRDSIWVDLGDPIQETEDGRRYKPLYAILCVDLDSRLNVNAHGSVADLNPPHYRSTALNPPMVGLIETPPGSGSYTATAGSIESGLVQLPTGPPCTRAPTLTDFEPGPNLAGSTLLPLQTVRRTCLADWVMARPKSACGQFSQDRWPI